MENVHEAKKDLNKVGKVWIIRNPFDMLSDIFVQLFRINRAMCLLLIEMVVFTFVILKKLPL